LVKNDRVFVNRSIRAMKVRCIDQDNQNIGIVLTSKALSLAEQVGLDLVQISFSKSDNVPTCKITDYGKFKYDLSKRNKQQAKKQRESIIKQKEIKFRPNTDRNDLFIKSKLVHKFLNDNFRVKIMVTLKGREMQHKWLAEEKMNYFLDILDEHFIESDRKVKIIQTTQFEGKSFFIVVDSEHDKIEKAS